jgi:hypothetical protein
MPFYRHDWGYSVIKIIYVNQCVIFLAILLTKFVDSVLEFIIIKFFLFLYFIYYLLFKDLYAYLIADYYHCRKFRYS